jgi:hypothetical protein
MFPASSSLLNRKHVTVMKIFVLYPVTACPYIKTAKKLTLVCTFSAVLFFASSYVSGKRDTYLVSLIKGERRKKG